MADDHNGTTVLVVDDDDDDRESLNELLTSYGFAVDAYGTARAFLEGFTLPQRGCLVLDVRLPDMSGLEVLQRLVTDGITLPTIMVTAYGDVRIAVAAMKAGAVDFIEKPISVDVLLHSLHLALSVDRGSDEHAQRASEVAERLALLTPREQQIFARLAHGDSNKAIARELGISPRTVEVHRARVMGKMQARNLADLVRMSLMAGGS